jgi:hypothetical protein
MKVDVMGPAQIAETRIAEKNFGRIAEIDFLSATTLTTLVTSTQYVA